MTATRAVSLPADANLTAPGYEPTTLAGLTAGDDPGSFYATPDADGAVYEHVEVRITVWRM